MPHPRKTHFIDQILTALILAIYFILQNYIQNHDIGSYLFNIYPEALDEKSMMIMVFYILRFFAVLVLPLYIILRIFLYIKRFKVNHKVKVKVAVYVLLMFVVVSIFSIFWTPRDAKKWMSNDVAYRHITFLWNEQSVCDENIEKVFHAIKFIKD